MKHTVLLITLISLSVAGCVRRDAGRHGITVTEASGVVRIGDRLLIVGDDSDGMFFEIALDPAGGRLIPVDPRKIRAIPLAKGDLAMDLESIDVLADGRIVVLSEQLRCILAAEESGGRARTVIAEYQRVLNEFGHRGLEGLAVLPLAGGGSRIAVLWEGGYPVYDDVPPQICSRIVGYPLKPVIVVHEIEKDGVAGSTVVPSREITLEVPEPPGEEPSAQRFRGTDLVWSVRGKDEERREEFIVLLCSENSPLVGDAAEKRYELKILQRFDLDGNPVGAPLDVNGAARDVLRSVTAGDRFRFGEAMSRHLDDITRILDEGNWENVNWEGLGWFEEGESLVAIYDGLPKDPPFAFIIDIPEEWK